MNVLWLESVGGAAGDMLLGALSGLGLDWERFVAPLEGGVPGLRIHRESVVRGGLAAWHVWCDTPDDQPERHLDEVLAVVDGLDLPDEVKGNAGAAFRRLAVAEAEAHGCPVEHVHFHEVGALDSIMDIVGFFWALHLLAVDRVEATPLRLGWGSVHTSHGELPVPVPAVAALVRGFPVEPGPGPGELTTPTGALLVTLTARRFGSMPAMEVSGCGVGAGGRETPHPNVLRAWLGTSFADDTVHLECNLDDVTPEALGFLRERLEAAGALDVTVLTGVGKKCRPVHLVQVIVPRALQPAALDVLFRHSPTLGVRSRDVSRICLPRRDVQVEVDGAPVRVKLAWWQGDLVHADPEYEDCAAVSRRTGQPLQDVMDEARSRARRSPPDRP